MILTQQSVLEKLTFLYGEERGAACYTRLMARLDAFRQENPALAAQPHDPARRVTERDAILITYGDSLQEDDQPPLRTLHRFLREHLHGVLSTVHILPFFPYSSDDGFSVIDYLRVDPALGDWADIQQLGADFRLMFDAVINHISAHSAWFQAFKAGDPAYREFFITVDPAADLSCVVRPRTLPLLTPVETPAGIEHVWTTFSDDQIDLNFASEDVLLRIIDVLLFYVAQGASFIRLDAIAYLWKEIGSSCIHLPQTHAVVQLFRAVLDLVAPQVSIISETNVPHVENMSYFGDGANEAQMIYQFTLPPLTLHAFITGDASQLSAWAAGIEPVSASATYFNFTASHDGIGVRPVEGILPPGEVQKLIERAQAHGGAVSYKHNSDGTQSPYELNINYFDALSDPAEDEPRAVQVQRFLASQAIMLAFVGVPGIYIHSLLGSRNWNAGVQQTGRLRTINREKLHRDDVQAALSDPDSLRSRVFNAYRHLLAVRTRERAFHPTAAQTVLDLDPALLALRRTAPDGSEQIVALHNVANRTVTLPPGALPAEQGALYRDVISGVAHDPRRALSVPPYGVLWLKAEQP
ncbi:MAG: sugar phosphorylase [Chloroflexi bacterium]|nr:sugar phosphorylase [Chloroflexota bacterium]